MLFQSNPQSPESFDPADALLAAFVAFGRGDISGEQAGQIAASRELARAATPDSCARLAEVLRDLSEDDNPDAVEVTCLLAAFILEHANTLYRLGRLPLALACYESVEATFRRLVEEEGRRELANDLAAARINRGIVEMEEEQGDVAEAMTYFRQVNARRLSADDRFRYHWSVGKARWKQGQREKALAHFRKGRWWLRRARQTAGSGEGVLTFLETRKGLFRDSVDCLLQMGNWEIGKLGDWEIGRGRRLGWCRRRRGTWCGSC